MLELFMLSLMVYHSSHHGNTKKVAQVIAEVLNAALIRLEDADLTSVEKYDLVGFGSGVYHGHYHPGIFTLVDRLPVFHNKKAFLFATSGTCHIKLINEFNPELINKLRQKGFDIVGTFVCRGYDTFGLLKYMGGINRARPNKKDLENAGSFAQEIMKEFA